VLELIGPASAVASSDGGGDPGAALVVADLGVDYGPVRALECVSFVVGWGEMVAVVGPNGAGKSSLFQAVCGLVPAHGTVQLAGRHCHHQTDRMGAAFIPQRADLDLDFPITVGEVVLGGRRRFGAWWRRPSSHDRAMASAAIDRVGLGGLAARPIGALSGGQIQRAFLGRALAQEAKVLLLDEALSGVDEPSTAEFLDLFATLVGEGVTVLVATHDLALARRRFDRCLAINRTLVADGAPNTALAGPALEATFGSGRISNGQPPRP